MTSTYGPDPASTEANGKVTNYFNGHWIRLQDVMCLNTDFGPDNNSLKKEFVLFRKVKWEGIRYSKRRINRIESIHFSY